MEQLVADSSSVEVRPRGARRTRDGEAARQRLRSGGEACRQDEAVAARARAPCANSASTRAGRGSSRTCGVRAPRRAGTSPARRSWSARRRGTPAPRRRPRAARRARAGSSPFAVTNGDDEISEWRNRSGVVATRSTSTYCATCAPSRSRSGEERARAARAAAADDAAGPSQGSAASAPARMHVEPGHRRARLHGEAQPVRPCRLDGLRVAGVGMTHDAEARVAGQHALAASRRPHRRAVRHDDHAGVQRVADADAAAVVHRHPRGPARGVQQRVEHGQSAMASLPSRIASVSRLGEATEPVSRWSRPITIGAETTPGAPGR